MEVHNKPLEDNPFLKNEDPYAAQKEAQREIPKDVLECMRLCYEVHTANPTGAHLRKYLTENFMIRSMTDMGILNLPENAGLIALYEIAFKKGVSMCWDYADMHARHIAGVNG